MEKIIFCAVVAGTKNWRKPFFSLNLCRQFADELFECVWPFCGIGTEGLSNVYKNSYIGMNDKPRWETVCVLL